MLKEELQQHLLPQTTVFAIGTAALLVATFPPPLIVPSYRGNDTGFCVSQSEEKGHNIYFVFGILFSQTLTGQITFRVYIFYLNLTFK